MAQGGILMPALLASANGKTVNIYYAWSEELAREVGKELARRWPEIHFEVVAKTNLPVILGWPWQ